MQLEISIDIRAEAKDIWNTLIDVERWGEWTRTVESAKRLDSGEFGMGSRVRMRQPRIPVATWKVTEFEPGKSFAWVSNAFGINSVANHLLEPRGDGTVSVTLTFAQTGWLARLVRSRSERIVREYVAIEAQGLKRRCEG